jgi:hypothetical protein
MLDSWRTRTHRHVRALPYQSRLGGRVRLVRGAGVGAAVAFRVGGLQVAPVVTATVHAWGRVVQVPPVPDVDQVPADGARLSGAWPALQCNRHAACAAGWCCHGVAVRWSCPDDGTTAEVPTCVRRAPDWRSATRNRMRLCVSSRSSWRWGCCSRRHRSMCGSDNRARRPCLCRCSTRNCSGPSTDQLRCWFPCRCAL